MNICIIKGGNLPVPAVKGGAVEVLLDLLVRLNEKYAKAQFYVISTWDEEAEVKSKSFKHTEYCYIKKNNKFQDILFIIARVINKVSRIISNVEICNYSPYYAAALSISKRIHPDYIVFEGGFYGAPFSKFLRYYKSEQLFFHLHGNWFPTKTVSKTIGNIISVSRFINNEYLKYNINQKLRSNIVYNCIDEDAFKKTISDTERQEIRNKYNFNDDDFIVLFCGRICADKGASELIEAVSNCNKKIKLLIVGSHNFGAQESSPYIKQIKKICEDYNDKIKFTGFVLNSQVYKYYQSVDCMCIPSMWDEPGALVNIEAQWSGLPIVATDSGGEIEYLSNENTIFVERDGFVVKKLTEAFEFLYKNPEVRSDMAKKSKERAAQFSMESYYKNYLTCFGI